MAHINLESGLEKMLQDGNNVIELIMLILILAFLLVYVWSVCCISRHAYSSNLAKGRLTKGVIAVFAILICVSPFLCISIFSAPHEWNQTTVVKPFYLWFSVGWVFLVISIAVWLNKSNREKP